MQSWVQRLPVKMALGMLPLALCYPRAAAGQLAPAEALTTFRLPPGWGIELVAAEPLVVSPAALSFVSPHDHMFFEDPSYNVIRFDDGIVTPAPPKGVES